MWTRTTTPNPLDLAHSATALVLRAITSATDAKSGAGITNARRGLANRIANGHGLASRIANGTAGIASTVAHGTANRVANGSGITMTNGIARIAHGIANCCAGIAYGSTTAATVTVSVGVVL